MPADTLPPEAAPDPGGEVRSRPARPATAPPAQTPVPLVPGADSEGRTLTIPRSISYSGRIGSCERLIVEGVVEIGLDGCRVLMVAAGGVFRGGAIALFLSFVMFWALLRRIDARWTRGLLAERRVGDVIEHALARPGCAFAHDVKEALGGSGSVDHIVMTPAGIWVVETKSRWQRKRRFPPALRQAAYNARRVRRHLDTSLPVRAALVIADRWDRSLESRHDWNGEPVTAFGLRTFWLLLRAECGQGGDGGSARDAARMEKTVWDLGSTRHPGS